jgi:hypothetical protein
LRLNELRLLTITHGTVLGTLKSVAINRKMIRLNINISEVSNTKLNLSTGNFR